MSRRRRWLPPGAVESIQSAYGDLVKRIAQENREAIQAGRFSGWVHRVRNDGGVHNLEALEAICRALLTAGDEVEEFMVLAFAENAYRAFQDIAGIDPLDQAVYVLARDVMSLAHRNGWVPADWEDEPEVVLSEQAPKRRRTG